MNRVPLPVPTRVHSALLLNALGRGQGAENQLRQALKAHRCSARSHWLLVLFPVVFASMPHLVAAAEPQWRFELGLALPYNIPMPLRIRQDGSPDLRLTARYVSRPLEPPVTWQLRAGRWNGRSAWELDLLHHKLFLDNPPPELDAFGISHGFNLLTLFRGWRTQNALVRAGLGIAIVHPENVVRGKRLSEHGGIFGSGYHFGGPSASVAAGRPLPLATRLFLDLEARLAVAYASVPVADGRADVFAVLLQLAVSLAWGEPWPDGSR